MCVTLQYRLPLRGTITGRGLGNLVLSSAQKDTGRVINSHVYINREKYILQKSTGTFVKKKNICSWKEENIIFQKKKSKTKRFDRRERGRKRTWRGEGRLCRGNDTTTDRDSYVVTGHRVKNSQHKVTKKIYCHSTFHVLFFLSCCTDKRERERKKREATRRAEDRKRDYRLITSRHFLSFFEGSTARLAGI